MKKFEIPDIVKYCPEFINTSAMLVNVASIIEETRDYLKRTPEEREHNLYEKLKIKYGEES